MAAVVEVPINVVAVGRRKIISLSPHSRRRNTNFIIRKPRRSLVLATASSQTPVQENNSIISHNITFPLMVNSCTGKMGKSVIEAAFKAGLDPIPVSFSSEEDSGKTMRIGHKEFELHRPSERENVLAKVLDQNPGLIVVDYTAPMAVNGNGCTRL